MDPVPSSEPRPTSAAPTRERLLDVAEELFAENGIAATSLRTITSAAGANLAAVHYHFGSKEGLLDAVVERRARPVNEARLLELERLEAGESALDVEALLGAFVLPAVGHMRDLGPRARHLARLLPRIEAQPAELVEELMRKHFGEVARRFLESLQSALADHDPATVAERLRFTAGVVSNLFSGNFDLDVIPDHPPTRPHAEELVAHALGFLAAGMRAPDPRRKAT